MKPNYIIPYIVFLLIIFSACKKLIEVKPPVDKLDRKRVFSTDANAIAAISGLYSKMISANLQFSSNAITVYGGLSADEIYSSLSPNDEFFSNNISVTNNNLRYNIWIPAYNLILQANNIIEGVEASNTITPSVRSQLAGEAKFIRAFCHFYLFNLFGEIPVITTTDYTISSLVSRKDSVVVYKQIISDLLDAKTLLKEDYPTAGKIRANKWTAAALLARVFLYSQDWSSAASAASEVIRSGAYTLCNSLNQVFLINSAEAIWQLQTIPDLPNTWDGGLFIPNAGAVPGYPLTAALRNSFSPNDLRISEWIKSVKVGANTYFHPYKYKVGSGGLLSEYTTVFRLAEQYLIRSEAYARQNKILESQKDLDMIRNRAGLANTAATSTVELLKAIEDERRCEYFVEWGHRWFDLKRNGRADAVLSSFKGSNWQSTDVLYPIPLSEILLNPSLTQNPGY